MATEGWAVLGTADGVPVIMRWDLLRSSLVVALLERRERESRYRLLIVLALAPFESVAAASQGQSLHRSG